MKTLTSHQPTVLDALSTSIPRNPYTRIRVSLYFSQGFMILGAIQPKRVKRSATETQQDLWLKAIRPRCLVGLFQKPNRPMYRSIPIP
jgi:hypothetical protein